MLLYASKNIPNGWLECNGQSLLRADYPKLFSVLDISWGNGNDPNRFNLPDTRGLFPRGWNHGKIS